MVIHGCTAYVDIVGLLRYMFDYCLSMHLLLLVIHGCTAYVNIVGLLRCSAYVGISGFFVKLVCLIVLLFFLVNVFFSVSACAAA